MAAGPFRFYHNGLKNCLNGNVDILTATVKAGLFLAAYTPDQDADDALDDISANECADVDYARQTVGSKTISVSNGQVVFDAADVDYGASVTITAKYLVLFKDSGVASTSYLIGYVDLDETGAGSATSSAAPFKVVFAADGIVGLVP